MTRTAARSSAVLLSALLWILPGGIQSAERSQDPRVSLAESPAQAVRQILAGWDDSRVRERKVLDLLEQDGSIEAATLRGDLLIWIPRGDETPRWKQKDRKFQPDTTPRGVYQRHLTELQDIVFERGEHSNDLRSGIDQQE